MTDIPHYDVAVIGYGPTGVTAANILGQIGLKVLVIERNPDIYGRARAISTDEEVLRIWQQVGLADRLQEDMLAGNAATFVDANGAPFTEIAPVSHGSGHPPQQFIYQPALEKVLRGGVERFPNVDVLLEHECLRVLQDATGVELMLADLRNDAFERVRASYVIAADGGASPTRAQLGIGYEGRTYAERWVVIDTKVLQEWPGHDRLRFHCNPDRPTVDCPTPLGHHRWEFPVRDDEDEDELVTDAAIWRVLNNQGITDTQVRILRAVVYSHHVRFADRWRVGRVFLAGDAAHAMPPWIGQGMSAGVRDVANLCWKLAAVLDGTLPESILDSYQLERLPHVREVTDRAVKVGRLITQRHPVLAAVRDRFFRIAMRVPGIPEWLRDNRWIPDAFYPRGLLAGPKAVASAAVGWLVPQPWVLDEKGSLERLDDVLGGRWTILHVGSPDSWPGWRTAGVPTVRLAGPGAAPAADTVVDTNGTLIRWMRAKGATVLALRPDGVVYAAAGPDTNLAPPPPGMKAASSIRLSEETETLA
ncbi:bifunctional 3-(3-hydroxy-phenyl)propionate/3-hydroxycinnamic acid hydroxylase [Rhodococcus aetherivorans]|uniref:Bifunctional 3-(3-hydroxy-phenyl)propionate/3-hydroxycinnamic acid hydroxylase n=1 Tax=Rhodococcus aetherivorans TaxID=191292 RepID=A0AA46PVZ8_9NOCA|nr:bifunctional 3-(3-hydroxy-phenyl)propionate/3-hydroxycinnamic acid hydroxylase [Rhodococcus aetherivorans]UYF94556.1 bifunctional 3-(3-hydroxy-phenyl)propionate/3-hydroxycinnamic acid hydroxylase [Rhodococcus aetherivorans]